MQYTFTPELVEIDVKEWQPEPDEKIFVREPTAGEYALYESISAKLHWQGLDDSERRKIYAEIAVRFARNAAGQRHFSPDMVQTLTEGNSKPLRRIAIKVAELGKLDEDEAKELEKNSPVSGIPE